MHYPVRVYMYLASMLNDTTGLPISFPKYDRVILYSILYCTVCIYIVLCCNHVVLSYCAVNRARCGGWAVCVGKYIQC